MLKVAVQASLYAKDYQFVLPGQQSEYLVAFAAALESGVSDEAFTLKYGITSGVLMYSENMAMEKGTILVDIVQVGSKRSLWRGALQGLGNLELNDAVR